MNRHIDYAIKLSGVSGRGKEREREREIYTDEMWL